MHNWKRIASAPRDGTVIFTDVGLVKFALFDGVSDWYICDIDGFLFNDSDSGPQLTAPYWWIPLPEIPAIPKKPKKPMKPNRLD